MGYQTQYELEVDDMQPLRDDSSWIPRFTIVKDLLMNVFNDTMKWYTHEKDMIELSGLFPTVTFELSGVGEEITMQDCDVWIKTFKGGKMIRHQKGEIVFKDV